jgi:hypothetical protein
MSYRNALLQKKRNVQDVENVGPLNVTNIAPPNVLNRNNSRSNKNNTNWLSKIQINEEPLVSEPEPFRNVNFPSPPSSPKNEYNYDFNKPYTKPELTEEQKRLVAEDPAGFLFLPTTLYIKDTPYYIYSQHYGECATDSFLNILFFADGYRDYFGKKADVLYKKLRNEHRYDLLHYTPFFKSEVKRLYEIVNGAKLPQDSFEQLVDIFARIVRRFIFVMLLNQTGYSIAEKLSEIIETKCPLTVKRKDVGLRRKSLNAMAGIDIHDAILEFLGEGKREKKNTNELVTKGLAATQILEVLNSFMNIIFAPRSKKLYYHWHPFEQTESIEPYLPFLKAIYLAPAAFDETKAGHAVSIFCHSNRWYLADNNLGITIYLPEFDPLKYFGPETLSQFFIFDFQNIRVKELLNGNNDVKVEGFTFDERMYSSYAIQRLQSATFYGFFVYVNGDKEQGAEQIIIAISRENLYPCFPMQEKFDLDQRLYFFAGTQEENQYNYNNFDEVNPNLPSPLKRTSLKKTKRRPRSKGKRRTTQRAKPPRANQTKNLKEQVENLRNASNDASNETFNEHMTQYFFRDKPSQKFTLGNFI